MFSKYPRLALVMETLDSEGFVTVATSRCHVTQVHLLHHECSPPQIMVINTFDLVGKTGFFEKGQYLQNHLCSLKISLHDYHFDVLISVRWCLNNFL